MVGAYILFCSASAQFALRLSQETPRLRSSSRSSTNLSTTYIDPLTKFCKELDHLDQLDLQAFQRRRRNSLRGPYLARLDQTRATAKHAARHSVPSPVLGSGRPITKTYPQDEGAGGLQKRRRKPLIWRARRASRPDSQAQKWAQLCTVADGA